MNTLTRLFCILIYTLFITACGGGGDETTEQPSPAPTAPVTPAPPAAPAAPDTVAPVIVLTGNSSFILEYGDSFNDPGATATDNVDGAVEVTASNPNPETLGTQQIVYTAVDAAGNSSSITRQLIIQDTTPPEINLLGDASVTIELGEGFSDSGALANDNYDGTLDVSVDFSEVDFQQVGAYNILYSVSDTSGNTSVTSRELIVEPPPVFTIMLEWVAPEFRQDGTPLSLDDIAGYKVYMGPDDSGMDVIALVDDPSSNSVDIEGLSRGVYWISISAIDENQLESPSSDAVRVIL
jgi:hypothetical protein